MQYFAIKKEKQATTKGIFILAKFSGEQNNLIRCKNPKKDFSFKLKIKFFAK